MDVGTERAAMGLVPRQNVLSRSRDRQDHDGATFVGTEVLEELAPLVAGPQGRVARAAAAPARLRSAVGESPAVAAASGGFLAPAASGGARHGRPRGSAPRRGPPSALGAEGGLAPVRFRSSPLIPEPDWRSPIVSVSPACPTRAAACEGERRASRRCLRGDGVIPFPAAIRARRRTKYRPDLLTHREHAAMMGACAGDEEDRCRL